VRAEAGATVVYTGRCRPELPPGLPVLDEWGVLPRQLHEVLAGAGRLVVLDAPSFPYESLSEAEWDLPMALALPPGLGFDTLAALLGPPVLSRLGLHDLVAGDDATGWDLVADEFVLPRGRFVAAAGDAALVAHVTGGDSPALGDRAAKAAFRAQAAAVAAAAGNSAGEASRALVVGCGRGAWAQVLARLGYAPVSFDLDREAVQEARRHFPGMAFHEFDGDAGLGGAPHDAGLALLAGIFTRLEPSGRARVLGQAWAGLRPGGVLLVLDRLVGEPGEPGWMAVSDLVAAVSEASAGAAGLEDVRSLRSEAGGLHETGLLSFRKPGTER
jgi:hypothetical protein